MLTQSQIKAILAAPGSFGWWCVASATGDPFFSHTPLGRILHVVTDSERKAQSAHTPSGPAMLLTEGD